MFCSSVPFRVCRLLELLNERAENMSMSGRIYSIIISLLAISVIIAGISIYGISKINEDTDRLGRLANRSLNLSRMSEISQGRSIGTLRIMIATSPERIKQLTEQYFAPAEQAMVDELADYQTNFPANPTEEMKQRPQRIQELWGAVVRTTAEVAVLASQNTNIQAMELINSMNAFWGDLDRNIIAICDSIGSGMPEQTVRWRAQIRGARASLYRYRYNIVRYVDTTDAVELELYGKAARESMEEIVALAKRGLDLPGGYAEKAQAIIDGIEKQARPAMLETLRLGAINSNAQATRSYIANVDPAFTKLDEYIDQLIGDALIFQKAALTATDERGVFTEWLCGIVSLVGVVFGSLLSWYTISRIVRKLHELIDGLGEAAVEVQGASGQISTASQSLAEGSTEQAASLEETSSALEQMASMTRQNADNANKANDTTVANNKTIVAGASAVENMSRAMNEISDSSEKISNIVKTIEEIALSFWN